MMEQNRKFEEAELTVVLFSEEDVITASGPEDCEGELIKEEEEEETTA